MKAINTKEDFAKLCEKLGLYYPDSPSKNAQILIHGSSNGVKAIESILKNGLQISNRDKVTDDYHDEVSQGLLSTNYLNNDPKTNEINFSKLDSGYALADKDYKFQSVISAIPLKIGKIYLGKIFENTKDRKDGFTCILDALNIEILPKEFILGVNYIDGITRESKFLINENFYALSKENYINALKSIQSIIENSNNENMINFLNHSKDSNYYAYANDEDAREFMDFFELNFREFEKELIKIAGSDEYKELVKANEQESKSACK